MGREFGGVPVLKITFFMFCSPKKNVFYVLDINRHSNPTCLFVVKVNFFYFN